MSLEQKCKVCGTFQKLANKRCSCGYNLAAGRKQEQVPIYKRLPGGKRKKLAMNVEEARLREAKIKISIAEGLDPEDEDATVQDLAEWYLNQRTVKKLRSNRDVVRVINKFCSHFGRRKVSDINTRSLIKKSDIREYREIRMVDDGVSPATADNEFRMIKTMFIAGDDDDKINPACLKAFRGVKKKLPKGANARKIVIPLSDLRQVYDASDSMFKAMILMALFTGMRGGEIRNLTPSHTALKQRADKASGSIVIEGLITLGPEMTKEPRTEDNPKLIPVTPTVGAALASMPRHINASTYFFTAEGKRLTKDGIVFRMKKGCDKVGIPYGRKVSGGVTFHDIRGTTKTLMEEFGMRKSIRDAVLGHAPDGMDRHYINPPLEDIKKAMLEFDAWLSSTWLECTRNCTRNTIARGLNVM